MKKKLSSFLLLILMNGISIAQSNSIVISGTIKNTSLKSIVNSHILNLTTGVGAISNKNGEFNIPVKEGDWLQVSNILFITKKIKIKNGNLKERTLLIYLTPIKNKLEEVILKKKMKGFLSLDRIEKRKDTIPKIDENYYNFSKMDLSIKEIKNLQDKSNAQYHTDPTMKNVATTIFSIGIPNTSLEKKRTQKRALILREKLPNKLLQLFGEHFFFVKLKIPKNKYYHFLEYCNQFKIEQLFKDEKHLEVLKILLKQSKSYLLLLENNK